MITVCEEGLQPNHRPLSNAKEVPFLCHGFLFLRWEGFGGANRGPCSWSMVSSLFFRVRGRELGGSRFRVSFFCCELWQPCWTESVGKNKTLIALKATGFAAQQFSRHDFAINIWNTPWLASWEIGRAAVFGACLRCRCQGKAYYGRKFGKDEAFGNTGEGLRS